MRQSSSLSSFKGETRSAISESKRVLGELTKTAKALPSKIRISSSQVRHNADDDDRGGSYDIEGEGKGVLADIISQQEQQAFLQEDNAKRVEESVERQFFGQKRVQIHLEHEPLRCGDGINKNNRDRPRPSPDREGASIDFTFSAAASCMSLIVTRSTLDCCSFHSWSVPNFFPQVDLDPFLPKKLPFYALLNALGVILL